MGVNVPVPTDRFAEIVGLAYEVVGEPEGWARCLTALSDAVGGSAASLHGRDIVDGSVVVDSAVRWDPSYVRQYVEHYSKLNPFMVGRQELLVEGQAVVGQMVRSDAELVTTEYWNDWMRPQDLFHLLGCIPLREGTWTSVLSVQRSERAGPYTTGDLELLRSLLPHLRRALQLQLRLGGLERLRDLSAAALDHLALGVIVVDAERKAVLLNRRAQDILAAADGLLVALDGLHAARPSDTAALRRLIADSCMAGVGRGLGSGGALALPRPSGKRPLHLLATALPHHRYTVAKDEAAAVVFVSDPERPADLPARLLEPLFDLTPAEARLAGQLLNGRNIADAAAESDVSLHTVRSQVGSMLEKTGTRRQSELLLELGRVPTALRR